VGGHELDGIALLGRFGGNLAFGFAEELEYSSSSPSSPVSLMGGFFRSQRRQIRGRPAWPDYRSEVEALEDDAQCLDALAEFLSDFGANLIEFGENDGTAATSLERGADPFRERRNA